MMRKHDWYSDTDPKALEVFLGCQRRMSPAEKMRSVFEQNELLRKFTEACERELHPEADDREIFLRVIARRLDRETMLRVYGWYPDPAS
jgi:hypothetical protein